MPVDRKAHPKSGRDAKLCALSDFEFRVWDQYKLSADDFGVMVADASAIQAANLALKNRPAKKVQAAIDLMVTIGLLVAFTHEGTRYVWSRKWQDYQAVRYPRVTTLPAPPPEDLGNASEETRELFGIHPGGLSVNSRKDPEKFRTHAGAPRGHAQNPNPNPNPSQDLDLDLDEERDLDRAPESPPLAAASPPFLEFPTSGTPKTWTLSEAQVAKWVPIYPGVDVRQECRKALAWADANPSKRKTANGMPKFLVNWLGRQQDRGPSSGYPAPHPAPSRGSATPDVEATRTLLDKTFGEARR